MTRLRLDKIRLNHSREKTPTPIVGDGGLANAQITDGLLLPVLILDTRQRPDIDEFIRLHDGATKGDVTCRWAQIRLSPHVFSLVLDFDRPARIVVVLDFDLRKDHAVLVEQILASRALILQAGRPGDRLKHDLNRPKVIVGIPELGVADHWSRLLLNYVRVRSRRRGLRGEEAKRAVDAYISRLRELAGFNMRGTDATKEDAPENAPRHLD